MRTEGDTEKNMVQQHVIQQLLTTNHSLLTLLQAILITTPTSLTTPTFSPNIFPTPHQIRLLTPLKSGPAPEHMHHQSPPSLPARHHHPLSSPTHQQSLQQRLAFTPAPIQRPQQPLTPTTSIRTQQSKQQSKQQQQPQRTQAC